MGVQGSIMLAMMNLSEPIRTELNRYRLNRNRTEPFPQYGSGFRLPKSGAEPNQTEPEHH